MIMILNESNDSGLLGPPWGFLGPPGASWGVLGPPVRLLGPRGASWGFLGLPGASWGFLGPPGASWGLSGPPGPSGPSWSFLGPPDASWGFQGLPGGYFRLKLRSPIPTMLTLRNLRGFGARIFPDLVIYEVLGHRCQIVWARAYILGGDERVKGLNI